MTKREEDEEEEEKQKKRRNSYGRSNEIMGHMGPKKKTVFNIGTQPFFFVF